MKFTRLLHWVLSGSAACGLSSCDRGPDPGLVEKIALLEAELRTSDQRVKEIQSEAKQAAAEPAENNSAAPDLDAARNAYLGFVEKVKSQVAGKLPDGGKIERTSVFPVEGPDPALPIHSRVAFQVSVKGRSGEIVVPISADPSGQWQEPDTSAILAKVKTQAASQPPSAPATNPPVQPQAPQHAATPNDVMGANRTQHVSWGDEPPAKPAPAPRQETPAPAPAPQPETRPGVQKPMPSNRDVIIKFD